MTKISTLLGGLLLSATLCSAMDFNPEAMYNTLKENHPFLSEEVFGNLYDYYEGDFQKIRHDVEKRAERATTTNPKLTPPKNQLPQSDLQETLLVTGEISIIRLDPTPKTTTHDYFTHFTSQTPISDDTFGLENLKINDQPDPKVIQRYYNEFNRIIKNSYVSNDIENIQMAFKLTSNKNAYDKAFITYLQKSLNEIEDILFKCTGKTYFHGPSFKVVDNKLVKITDDGSRQTHWPSMHLDPFAVRELEIERAEIFKYLTLHR